MGSDEKDLSPEDRRRIEAADRRYYDAAHGVQAGIGMWMDLDPVLFTPKHLRVGIDAQKADLWGLAKLLMDKNVITRVEYHEAMAASMEEERGRWEKEIGERLGSKITLR
jgi:hypothetical protein